jgi:hypothetical protein
MTRRGSKFGNTIPADRAVWELVASNARVVLIRDAGGDKSVTNDAEQVVASLAPALRGRRLFYVDTIGRVDELVYDLELGGFVAFRPGFDDAEKFGAAFFNPFSGGEL